MKIDASLLPQSNIAPDGGPSRQPGAARTSADTRETGGDIRVIRSGTLDGIEKGLAAGTVNAARVEAIRQALASGQYQIDTERIASGLISSALQNLSKGESA